MKHLINRFLYLFGYKTRPVEKKFNHQGRWYFYPLNTCFDDRTLIIDSKGTILAKVTTKDSAETIVKLINKAYYE